MKFPFPVTARQLLDHSSEDPLGLCLEANRGLLDNFGRVLSGVESLTGEKVDFAQGDHAGLVVEFVTEVATEERYDTDVVCSAIRIRAWPQKSPFYKCLLVMNVLYWNLGMKAS